MLEGAAPELVDAVCEQAALVKGAHLPALVRVARRLRVALNAIVGMRARLVPGCGWDVAREFR